MLILLTINHYQTLIRRRYHMYKDLRAYEIPKQQIPEEWVAPSLVNKRNKREAKKLIWENRRKIRKATKGNNHE